MDDPGKINFPDRLAAVQFLIREGKRRLEGSSATADFETGIPEAERLLNDIQRTPHIFFLGCVMDRQIKASRAWSIPYKVGRALGGFELHRMAATRLDEIENLFEVEKLHRFNGEMANNFWLGVQRIVDNYDGDASQIWADCPIGAAVIRRFLEFRGVGPKIANMAANILVRDFKVPMSNYSSFDIAPDARVMRFFKSNKLLRPEGTTQEMIYLARELHPEFPGLLDIGAWKWGR